ncbi:hypothetical protein SALBM135S_03204 [Streptomyces alboniger]
MPGAYRDTVHEQLGTDAAQRGVDVVDGTARGAARRDDEVGRGLRDRLVQPLGVVPEPPDPGDLGAERTQPRRQHRTERVTDEALARQPLGQQLVSEYEDFGAGPAHGGERVVPGGRREAEHGGRDQGTRRQQMLAGTALLAAGPDVLALRQVAQREQPALVVGVPVLAAQHRGGVTRDGGARRDAHRLAVAERRGPAVPGEHSVGAYVPGARARDGPAVHGRGVEGRQIGEGGERGGQDRSERLRQRHRSTRPLRRPGRSRGAGAGDVP